jgi:hypothetical protein
MLEKNLKHENEKKNWGIVYMNNINTLDFNIFPNLLVYLTS